MMSLKHPANPRFSLFHSIDKHWKDDCYLVTCLKSANSLAHAMIVALLPYLKWTLKAEHGKIAMVQVPKWFKPATCLQSTEAFWDPKEECIRNKSDEMLMAVLSNADRLYWEAEVQEAPPKQKKIKVDNESVSDSILMVKTAISSIRNRSSHTSAQTTTNEEKVTKTPTDAKTVDSQMSTITQLTKQVLILQLAHNEINSKLNKLTKFIMAQAAKPVTPTQSKRKAAGSLRGSPSHKT